MINIHDIEVSISAWVSHAMPLNSVMFVYVFHVQRKLHVYMSKYHYDPYNYNHANLVLLP